MFGININRDLDLSLTRQICDQLRTLIEDNILKTGEQLPSTRKIAQELKVSRNVMVEVYEQLKAEGYLRSQVGSGTYVNDNIIKNIEKQKENIFKTNTKIQRISKNREDLIDFTGGIPDLRSFPQHLWSKYLKLATDEIPDYLLGYGDILGDYELKKVLSEYIFRFKGIQCHPEQIIIVSGSSAGLMLIANLFKKNINSTFIEEPTVNFIRNIFINLNYKIYPVDVDQNGMMVNNLVENEESTLIVVTPSHQFPTGSVLPIQRRQQLIKIAEATDSYLIEDDYDSEFRLKGVPIPPIQVLRPSRVIYVGTFSKNLYPGLRLGFLIVPPHLVKTFQELKTELNIYTSIIKQRAMANFIKDKHLDRHIYKMKKVYKKRRLLLSNILKDVFNDEIIIRGDETGMHLQVEFIANKYSHLDWEKVEEYGVKVESFEEYCFKQGNHNNKVVLGYGNLNSTEIKIGIKRLIDFIKTNSKN